VARSSAFPATSLRAVRDPRSSCAESRVEIGLDVSLPIVSALTDLLEDISAGALPRDGCRVLPGVEGAATIEPDRLPHTLKNDPPRVLAPVAVRSHSSGELELSGLVK